MCNINNNIEVQNRCEDALHATSVIRFAVKKKAYEWIVDSRKGYYSLVAATLVEEVKVLDEKAEEGHYDPLAFVCSASATPHCGLQRATIAAEITARVHLMLQNRELGRLYLRPLKDIERNVSCLL